MSQQTDFLVVGAGVVGLAIARSLALAGVKRRTRAGMGLCQGQSCGKLISRIIARETGISISEIVPMRKRPPVNPITLGELASGAEGLKRGDE
jgi:ribulose 1,5-bisphosphate synthetase/thiazole synthase